MRSAGASQSAMRASVCAGMVSVHHHNEMVSDGGGSGVGATKPGISAPIIMFANAEAIAYHVANSSTWRIGGSIGIACEQACGETRDATCQGFAHRDAGAPRFF